MRKEIKPNPAPVWTGEFETGSPLLGVVCIAVTARGLLALELIDNPAGFHARFASRLGPGDDRALLQVPAFLGQVREYLDGKRRYFEMPIDWSEMPPFQLKTLGATRGIPYGQIRTYSSLAHEVHKSNAARAVGSALAANPMAIVIPCHRVVGVDRALHGYAAPGGLETKAWLLQLEGRVVRSLHVAGDWQAGV
jgi:methylated-DNA-[protein]-cysteine S-methyltransferase